MTSRILPKYFLSDMDVGWSLLRRSIVTHPASQHAERAGMGLRFRRSRAGPRGAKRKKRKGTETQPRKIPGCVSKISAVEKLPCGRDDAQKK
jgi:hypothetical protein